MTFPEYLEEVKRLYESSGLDFQLNPGVSGPLLAEVQAELGAPIEDDLRTAWSVANGGPEYQPLFVPPGTVLGYDFISVERALYLRREMALLQPNYQGYREPTARDQRVRSGWFHPGWLPVGEFIGGAVLMADHSPSDFGSVGQILTYVHDPDEISFVSATFGGFLAESIACLREVFDEIVENL